MKIAVIGVGVVGSHMAKDIVGAGHRAFLYDPPRGPLDSKDDINNCDAAFVCVGTPALPDGSADMSQIEDVFSWLNVPVAIVRSTIPPGTKFPSWVAFSPEFIGEGVNAPYNAMKQPPFVIIGADSPNTQEDAANVFAHLYNAECEFVFLDLITAQVAKYAENYFLALKVTYSNELYNICQKLGANFCQMMSAVTHDYRIGRSHTHVYRDKRGWDGRCLPKDTSALLRSVGADTAPLLASMIQINEAQRHA
jgi:UDPglucose 6-dehydrogenase